ncbi:hypothetical protein VOLCADRAFT_89983 [Volvox carteri f. nagariensis]|uniref:Uncharacterized protein n=1 Tax=Volvox carteri f. nagariensis TaxID=3068 RepID=D8TT64_VOLCA|nr:uncharacterized protein VOLCADRAFT_89983 [Volvox carteri f. nagariensis]EFJ49256.1 hypothetical protein VOLCADRAFT_89983 [Volvox carteri f. nagariensis]|eukprot:XP_002949704.1 hypothetical protein VOLCADRAFT_89983 [Volvox carteri f. nagariensis]
MSSVPRAWWAPGKGPLRRCSGSPGPSTAPHHAAAPILVLEAVKEVEDAFTVVKLLREADVPLLQEKAMLRPARQGAAKWVAIPGRVIEFFSALGILTEVSSPGYGKVGLAELGYRAGPTYAGKDDPSDGGNSPGHSVRQRGTDCRGASLTAACTAAEPPEWLRVTGWRLPRDLEVTPLECVTSRRLVTSAEERNWVLAEARSVSGGLRIFGSDFRDGDEVFSAPSLPVPTASVSTAEDVWASSPVLRRFQQHSNRWQAQATLGINARFLHLVTSDQLQVAQLTCTSWMTETDPPTHTHNGEESYFVFQAQCANGALTEP